MKAKRGGKSLKKKAAKRPLFSKKAAKKAAKKAGKAGKKSAKRAAKKAAGAARKTARAAKKAGKKSKKGGKKWVNNMKEINEISELFFWRLDISIFYEFNVFKINQYIIIIFFFYLYF